MEVTSRSRMSKAIGVAIVVSILCELSAGARTLKQPELIIPEIALTPAAFTPAEANAPAALLIVEPVAFASTPAGAAAPAEAPSPTVGVVVEIPFGEAAAPAGGAAAPGPVEVVGFIVDTVVPAVPEDFFASPPASPSSE